MELVVILVPNGNGSGQISGTAKGKNAESSVEASIGSVLIQVHLNSDASPFRESLKKSLTFSSVFTKTGSF
jgi:hypothetical protein